MCVLFEIEFCTLTMIPCPLDIYIFNTMQPMIAVQQFFHSLLSRQNGKVEVAPVMINKNKFCHVIRILHTHMFLLTYSQYFIFG